MRRNKYNARKTKRDGILFDSKLEANRYTELQLLARAGQIKDIELQPEFELIPAYRRRDGKRIRATKYRADFRYYDCMQMRFVVEDVKGMETAVFKIKRKLLEWRYPDVILSIVN